MAMNTHAPRQTNWWVRGGAAVTAILVIAAIGYGFDWFGMGGVETTAPVAEQAAPATD
jgi:hypothetical protein